MPSTILSDNGVSSGSAGLKTTAASDGALVLQTTTSGGTATNALYVDTSQNVALGVAPSAWSVGKALELNTVGQGIWATSSATVLTNNLYYNGSYKFAGTGYASRLVLSGQYQSIDVSTTSGSAGGAITFASPLSTGYNQTVALQGATQSAGTGIAFPATQSASSDANTLDDYEEGTWGPVTLTNGTCTLTNSRYTKIGRLVTISGYLQTFSDRSTATTLNINGGFPYAPSAATENCGAMIAQYVNGSYSAAYVSSGGMFFYGITSGAFTTLKNSDLNNASAQIYFTVTYTTST